MLALLPVFATLTGAVVLRQIPTAADLAGIALVVAGVELHRAPVQSTKRARATADAGTGGCPVSGAGPDLMRLGC